MPLLGAVGRVKGAAPEVASRTPLGARGMAWLRRITPTGPRAPLGAAERGPAKGETSCPLSIGSEYAVAACAEPAEAIKKNATSFGAGSAARFIDLDMGALPVRESLSRT